MKPKKDEFHIKGTAPDGNGVYGIRKTDGGDTEAVLVPITEGQPLPPGAEVIQTRPRSEDVLEVRSVYKVKGPSQVATPQYRENYDQIFGKKKSTAHDIN
jgi:hypothetical protein